MSGPKMRSQLHKGMYAPEVVEALSELLVAGEEESGRLVQAQGLIQSALLLHVTRLSSNQGAAVKEACQAPIRRSVG